MSDNPAEPEQHTATPVETPRANPQARRRWLIILGVVVGVGIIAFIVYKLLFGGVSESTDDAYVGGDVVSITAREPGTVISINADNTETVRAGQTLVEFDPATVDVNMAAAEAELARAVRAVRSNFASVDEGQAEVNRAKAELAQALGDLSRRRGAAAGGAVSGEEVAHAADAVTTARAALALAESHRTQAQTTVQGTSIRSNPAVMTAIAQFRRAAIAEQHMRLISPVDGTIAQRTVQLGQQVGPGVPLMSVVPLNRVWVDANFRETQLRHLRVGQPVKIKADIYGGDAVFTGHVVGLAAGSGSAFALLPPQNASGNWIKIVQRLPVRIALNSDELRQHPLRIGLSVKATVDTTDRSGSLLGAPARGVIGQTGSQEGGPDLEARINRVIASNRGFAQ
jgi:membrane fusion protein (multidrug efflux system)